MIAARDERRGETVVPPWWQAARGLQGQGERARHRGRGPWATWRPTRARAWSLVVDSLPSPAPAAVQWRALQESESALR